jgi:hypothetical protein
MKYNIIVIGSGPGGYVAAIRASQLGKKVAIVEKAELGGVCLNWGCIPTKVLLKSAQVFTYCKNAAHYGVAVEGEVKPDFEKIVARSRTVADTMSKGVAFLMKKNNIDILTGWGRLAGEGKVEVDGTLYEADAVILATGARPRQMPFMPVDGEHVISSKEALTLPRLPQSMIVVGSGAIGSEFACLYASLGVKCEPLSGLSFALTSDVAYSTLYNNFEGGKNPRRISSISVFAAKYNVAGFAVTATLLGTYMADEVKVGVTPEPYKRLSPSLALMYQPIASFPLRLRASYKDTYRVPTFADLYYLRLGNVGLKPEKASQFNFGLIWNESFGRVVKYASVVVDGYYNKVKDKIVALPTMYVWRMMNFGEAEIAGVDANVQAELAMSRKVSLLLDAGYSYQYAVDVTDSSAKNYRHQIPYTPRNSGKFTLSVLNPYVNVSYIFTAVGERYMLPQNTTRNRIDGYLEHSLSMNRDFDFQACSLRLQGELLNIGNRQYEIIRYYPMPRFSWRLSARLNF